MRYGRDLELVAGGSQTLTPPDRLVLALFMRSKTSAPNQSTADDHAVIVSCIRLPERRRTILAFTAGTFAHLARVAPGILRCWAATYRGQWPFLARVRRQICWTERSAISLGIRLDGPSISRFVVDVSSHRGCGRALHENQTDYRP